MLKVMDFLSVFWNLISLQDVIDLNLVQNIFNTSVTKLICKQGLKYLFTQTHAYRYLHTVYACVMMLPHVLGQLIQECVAMKPAGR